MNGLRSVSEDKTLEICDHLTQHTTMISRVLQCLGVLPLVATSVQLAQQYYLYSLCASWCYVPVFWCRFVRLCF